MARPASATDVPPVVSIISHANGATLTRTVTAEASAIDDNDLSFVDFFMDGVRFNTREYCSESSPKLVEILHGSQVQLGDLRRG